MARRTRKRVVRRWLSYADPRRIGPILDISTWQGGVDFHKIRRAGVTGVIIKATEGETYRDPSFTKFWREAGAAGLVLGSYHFGRPDNNSAKSEARHYVNTMRMIHGGKHAFSEGNFVPILDYEHTPLSSTWRDLWFVEVKRLTGHDGMLYTYPGFGSWRPDTRRLWIAHYTGRPGSYALPRGYKRAQLHQYTDKGRIPGVSSPCDISRVIGGTRGRLNRLRCHVNG